MIEFRSASCVYPNGVRALSAVNLAIEKGEFVFLTGSSGAGKSTLLKLIHCQLKPAYGEVRVMGNNTKELCAGRVSLLRRNVGFVFQDFALLEDQTVFDNVAYPLEVIGTTGREIRKKVSRVLSLVGLTHKTYKKVNHISCGEQQRVSIARAIVNGPEILLADEPTGHVDQDTGWEIIQILERIQREGATVLVATHNSAWMQKLDKRVVVLHGGELIEDDEKDVNGFGVAGSLLLRA